MKNTCITPCLAGAAFLALLPLTAAAQEIDPAKMEEVMKKYGSPAGAQGLQFLSRCLEADYWMARPTHEQQGSKFVAKAAISSTFKRIKWSRHRSGTCLTTRPSTSTPGSTHGTGIMISRGTVSETESITPATTRIP